MLKLCLCDYNNAYILVNGVISVVNTVGVGATAANNNDKKVIFKNCAPFADCISEIKNTHIVNAKDIDVVIPMYNLRKCSCCSGNYLKTLRNLWQYYKDEQTLTEADIIVDFTGNSITEDDDAQDVKIKVLLKYLSNF